MDVHFRASALGHRIAVATVALVLAACGGTSAPTTMVTTTTSPPTPTTDPPSTTTTLDPSINLVEVVFVGIRFGGIPPTIPVGSRFTVESMSGTLLHELAAFKLADDETRTMLEFYRMPRADLFALLGEPTILLMAPPGGEQISLVGDGTVTEPGRYAIFCFIPGGEFEMDPFLDVVTSQGVRPPFDVGISHADGGMYAEVIVEGD